ncbi:MAG: NAD(P)/FAD-dependent oxidoreductase [Candidatus Thermoplasmatota archaeon]|nr:NAD(P)/FAD-dependent oxidoreductase [Candidatus Thermoplasmatota archaeon]
MPKTDYDVIIIGAGTAGLSAGAVLERSGMDYIILDKKREIGLPVRSTGAVSMEWVKRIGMPTDSSIVSANISSMSFRTDKGNSINLNFDRTVGIVYDFTAYEKFLSSKFAGNLNIRMNTRVNSVEGNTVYTDSGSYVGKHIIFAAGPQSNFGKKLPRNEVLVAYEEIRKASPRADYQMVLWFSDMAPGGYFWDFADKGGRRKIGVCYYPTEGKSPKEVLDRFTEKYPEISGECIDTMAHQIPLGEPAPSVTSGSYLYTGDMVNAVLNTTAGGLQGAFWTGKTAAEAVIAGDHSLYQKKWDEEIRPWLLKHHRLHRRMHRKGVKSISRLMTLAKIMPMSVKKKVFGGL